MFVKASTDCYVARDATYVAPRSDLSMMGLSATTVRNLDLEQQLEAIFDDYRALPFGQLMASYELSALAGLCGHPEESALLRQQVQLELQPSHVTIELNRGDWSQSSWGDTYAQPTRKRNGYTQPGTVELCAIASSGTSVTGTWYCVATSEERIEGYTVDSGNVRGLESGLPLQPIDSLASEPQHTTTFATGYPGDHLVVFAPADGSPAVTKVVRINDEATHNQLLAVRSHLTTMWKLAEFGIDGPNPSDHTVAYAGGRPVKTGRSTDDDADDLLSMPMGSEQTKFLPLKAVHIDEQRNEQQVFLYAVRTAPKAASLFSSGNEGWMIVDATFGAQDTRFRADGFGYILGGPVNTLENCVEEFLGDNEYPRGMIKIEWDPEASGVCADVPAKFSKVAKTRGQSTAQQTANKSGLASLGLALGGILTLWCPPVSAGFFTASAAVGTFSALKSAEANLQRDETHRLNLTIDIIGVAAGLLGMGGLIANVGKINTARGAFAGLSGTGLRLMGQAELGASGVEFLLLSYQGLDDINAIRQRGDLDNDQKLWLIARTLGQLAVGGGMMALGRHAEANTPKTRVPAIPWSARGRRTWSDVIDRRITLLRNRPDVPDEQLLDTLTQDFKGSWQATRSALMDGRLPDGRAIVPSPELMQRFVAIRKRHVDNMLEDVKAQVTRDYPNRQGENLVEFSNVGTNHLTSDIDITVSGSLSRVATTRFMERFYSLYGTSSSRLFDVNLYPKDFSRGLRSRQVTWDPSNVESVTVEPHEHFRFLSPEVASTDRKSQYLWSMARLREEVSQAEWKALKESLPHKHRDLMTSANNRFQRIKRRRLTQSGDDLYQKALNDITDIEERIYQIESRQTKESMMPGAPETVALEHLYLDLRDKMSESLMYATDGYITEGPVHHVVTGQQGRRQYGVKPQVQLERKYLFIHSANEQGAFILSKLQDPMADNLTRVGKYYSRLRECLAGLNASYLETKHGLDELAELLEQAGEVRADPNALRQLVPQVQRQLRNMGIQDTAQLRRKLLSLLSDINYLRWSL